MAAAKRFWKEVTVEPVAGGYAIALDGRPVRTPARQPLVLPVSEAAEAVAAEWRAQTGHVNPATMPFTRLANTTIDRVRLAVDGGGREAVIDEIVRYGGSDLLCYRAEAPESLSGRQAAAWDPLLGWLKERFGVSLRVTSGIVHVPQDAAGLAKLRAHVAVFDDFSLVSLSDAVSLSGSLVIGLALAEGRIDASEAWALSTIDEAFQIEQWGDDAEAAARLGERAKALTECAEFLSFFRGLRG